jgi:protein CLEC16A
MQTLSILISNISKTTSMFFLFSNNHLNDIIGLGYDLRDEEVLAHYITLLKAISFKINVDTIQFFFHTDAASRCALL